MNIMGFLKIFGLVLAAFVGLFAAVIGGIFVTGGFKPPYIPPEGLYFEYEELTIDEDTDILVLPTPDNATELDIELSILTGNSIISIPETAKMNEPITVEVLKDEDENNIGGVARIRANQGLFVAECTIFVDTPIESFSIFSSGEVSIYVGDSFIVSPTEVYPEYSLNPTILNQNYNKENKVVKYYSSNEEVATVDELTGEVTPLTEGIFTIEARVIKTYNLVAEEPNPLDFEYEEDYWAEMDAISVVSERQFTVSSIAVAGIFVNDDLEDPLYELDLHKKHTFTPTDFGLQLLPQADSTFTAEQLNYKLKDLVVTASNPNVLEVVQTDEPLTYTITVLNYETWQIQQTNIHFFYSDDIQAYVHFKILRNDITGITIEENVQNAIEVILDPENPQTFDLEENTTIQVVDPQKEPTYEKLMYKVDLAQSENELSERIISIDPVTGYITNNMIIPLHRGTTRIKAFVIQTRIPDEPDFDEQGNPIANEPVLDEYGNYIIMFEMTEYVTVNILEQLTSLAAELKKPKVQTIILGENIQVSATNLTEDQVAMYLAGELDFTVSDDTKVEVIDTALVDSTLTITLRTLEEGQVNLFLMDMITKMFIDYVEINTILGTPSPELVSYEFDVASQEITSLIRGTEGFLVFTPNSYGAFIDAYKYDKIEFISTSTNMIQIYSSIDARSNIIVKLVAVGFDTNADLSYSMIRIRLIDAAVNDYLVNERINVDIGAVNGIYLEVNSTTINAIPDENGTQWLTPENEDLSVSVTFSEPEEPAVIGVQYISSDTSILEIDNNIIDEDGNPAFTFKKAGIVVLTAKSLDPYAIPTDPENVGLGAYSSVILTVTVPTVVTKFNYNNLVSGAEQIVAGDAIDLLAEEIDVSGELKPRVKIERNDGVDYTNLAQFEIENVTTAAQLNEVAANQTFGILREINVVTEPIGVTVVINIRIYTDFGFETTYLVRIVPDIISTITYKDDNDPFTPNLPEVIYPPTDGTVVIKLLELQDDVVRVNITNLDEEAIDTLQFESNNISAGIVNSLGEVTVWETSIERALQIRIFIEFESGINFETFYEITVIPNIEVQADYSNFVIDGMYQYEQISFATTYDLVIQNKINANTIVPYGADITSELLFAMAESNEYITISSQGVLSYLQTKITEEQNIAIRVYTIYGYAITYRIKVLIS